MTTPPTDIPLRDWFAGMAMLMPVLVSPQDLRSVTRDVCSGEPVPSYRERISEAAYRQADAMLAERARETAQGIDGRRPCDCTGEIYWNEVAGAFVPYADCRCDWCMQDRKRRIAEHDAEAETKGGGNVG